MSEYVLERETEFGRTSIENLDGVSWTDAPKPRRFHRHWAQTRGWINWFSLVERCACGAIRLDGRRRWTKG